jgi:hypothetical protein
VFATTDPTDLADALVQNAKAPARFAIGALAAMRLLPLLGAEWQALALARRARGIDAGHNPIARLRLFGSTAFALPGGGTAPRRPPGGSDGRARLRLGRGADVRPPPGLHPRGHGVVGGGRPAVRRRTHHHSAGRPVPPIIG